MKIIFKWCIHYLTTPFILSLCANIFQIYKFYSFKRSKDKALKEKLTQQKQLFNIKWKYMKKEFKNEHQDNKENLQTNKEKIKFQKYKYKNIQLDKCVDAFFEIEAQANIANKKIKEMQMSHKYMRHVARKYNVNINNSAFKNKKNILILNNIIEDSIYKKIFIRLSHWCLNSKRHLKTNLIEKNIGLQYINFIDSHTKILKRTNINNAMTVCYTMYRELKGDNKHERPIKRPRNH